MNCNENPNLFDEETIVKENTSDFLNALNEETLHDTFKEKLKDSLIREKNIEWLHENNCPQKSQVKKVNHLPQHIHDMFK